MVDPGIRIQQLAEHLIELNALFMHGVEVGAYENRRLAGSGIRSYNTEYRLMVSVEKPDIPGIAEDGRIPAYFGKLTHERSKIVLDVYFSRLGNPDKRYLLQYSVLDSLDDSGRTATHE